NRGGSEAAGRRRRTNGSSPPAEWDIFSRHKWDIFGFSRTFGESGPAVGGTPVGEVSFVLAVRDVSCATPCSSGARADLYGPWCAWDHDPPACEAKARSVPRLRRADGSDP